MIQKRTRLLAADLGDIFLQNPALEENKEPYSRLLKNGPQILRDEAIDDLLRRTEALHAENKKLRDENAELKMPPLEPAVVLKPDYLNEDNREMVFVVTLSERYLSCELPKDPLLRQRLQAGAEVVLNQGVIIYVVGDFQGNIIGRITRVRENFEVTTANPATGEEMILVLAEWLRDKGVKPGAHVRYDPGARLVTELVESPAEKQARTILDRLPKDLNWDDFVVDPEIRAYVEDIFLDIQECFEKEEPVRHLGLIYGPPGVGKTHFTKVFALELAKYISEERLEWIFVRGAEKISSWLGESERATKEVFDKARINAAEGKITIIIWDELEAIVPRRGQGGHLWPDTIANTFLAELDGVDNLENTIFWATTNKPELVEPALLRPRRLGQNLLGFPRPGWMETEQLFRIYLERTTAELESFPAAMAARAAAYLWAPANKRQAPPLAIVRFRNNATEAIPRTAVLSGDIVRGAVSQSTRLAKRTRRGGGKELITFEMLCQGIDITFRNIILSAENLIDYVDWSPSKCAKVEAIIRPERRS